MSSNRVLDDAAMQVAISAAMKEGKLKGLPDGWRVTIDKRKRRKWISPTGRSCDSIPKALTMSVELGLLPSDTPIPVHTKKRRLSSKNTVASRKKPTATDPTSSPPAATPAPMQGSDEEIEYDTGPESDPETSLDIIPRLESSSRSTRHSTVHWDPQSSDGRKVGWKIRIWDSKKWNDGRVIRFDPYSLKHKIQYDGKGKQSVWLRLMNEVYQCASRLVWAHVKGFSWWPGMIMECDPPTFGTTKGLKEGYAFVAFFGSDEVATLKDSLEYIRSFTGETIDPVVAKHKKKRNANAFKLACQEEDAIRDARNAACRFYATKAFGFANKRGSHLLGKRLELFRSDVNYPYGDTVVGTVRTYSTATKKWLLSYEISERTRVKYESSWMNLLSKDVKYKHLDKKKPHIPNLPDIVPFLHGFDSGATTTGDESSDMTLSELLTERCWACVDCILDKQQQVLCQKCSGKFHVGCVDWPKSAKSSPRTPTDDWICSKCTPCLGCSQSDIVFGSHPQTVPQSLSLHPGDSLNLCFMCIDAYEAKRFCPNCAHSWNDAKYQKVKRRRALDSSRGEKKRGGTMEELDDGEDDGDAADDEEITVVEIEPSWYHPDTPVWGYTEGTMLICDGCDLWVHAACGGLTEEEYLRTSDGEHPIYSKEFLCHACCRSRCRQIIGELRKEDRLYLFAIPVTEEMAPTYNDVIKNPMDLQTMAIRVERDDYLNYAWLRDDFELMVFNALTFNRSHTKYWDEAKRYYEACLRKVFGKIGKGAPPGRYSRDVENSFEKADHAKRLEQERVQEDDTAEKKDLVAGSDVATITLPPLGKPPDLSSCLPHAEVFLKPVDAYFASWMDCCYTCGSSGAADTMLFCVDCGEAFHSFCANAPVHSMEISSLSGWRCPNCKICEISGEVPPDELRMLFCEMCDRAFSLDLIDPPLEKAPSGLWICGQCIDCKACKNTSEADGASLKSWSSDPEKCFRCGGCEAFYASASSVPMCEICLKYWRREDNNLVSCSSCESSVHEQCDSVARDFSKKRLSQQQKVKYECPQCRRKHGGDREVLNDLRRDLYDQTWIAVLKQCGSPESNHDIIEGRKELCRQIDSAIRNMWREEYVAVVLEAFRVLDIAKTRYVRVQTMVSRFDHVELPVWMAQRAVRFMRLVEGGKWNISNVASRRIESLVIVAKMAAAFLKVTCRVMGLKTKKTIKCYDKMMSLLEAPTKCGFVEIPMDVIKVEGNSGVIQSLEWNSTFEPKLLLPPEIPQAALQPEPQLSVSRQESTVYKVAAPLVGWNSEIETSDDENRWNDPRECCLCHMCGDDDAGFSSTEAVEDSCFEAGPRIAHVGRLLPTRDGMWVHASCVLWSSEVWEAETGGEIYSMEKARSRGSQLKCFGCGRHGATVGCQRPNCSNNYHFPCAKACGAVFTTAQQCFCSLHTSFATSLLPKESFELMKTLTIAPEKTIVADDTTETKLCSRVGCIIVHSLGTIDTRRDDFHSAKYIFPRGFFATRIYWSGRSPRTRTVYILQVDAGRDGQPVFSITAGDAPDKPLRGTSVDEVYSALISRIRAVNRELFSDDLFSKLPVPRKTSKKTFGLNGPQFFGFGLDHVRKALEQCPGVEATAAPLTASSVSYRFCFHQPPLEAVMDLQRKRAAVAAERALENASGSARTEGMQAVAQSTGSGRITRALVRSVEEDGPNDIKRTEQDELKAKADRESNQRKYNELKSAPLESRLAARRSHIHGWGLFCKVDMPKDSMIVEYMGETVRRSVADRREKMYETSGIGSCYMFRLDLQRIVDATTIGCMARFMNHCCRPNAYAKIIAVDTELGPDKKIVVFANRAISAGEEVTYDYKFPVEDGSLKCTCGAPNCIGRMN